MPNSYDIPENCQYLFDTSVRREEIMMIKKMKKTTSLSVVDACEDRASLFRYAWIMCLAWCEIYYIRVFESVLLMIVIFVYVYSYYTLKTICLLFFLSQCPCVYMIMHNLFIFNSSFKLTNWIIIYVSSVLERLLCAPVCFMGMRFDILYVFLRICCKQMERVPRRNLAIPAASFQLVVPIIHILGDPSWMARYRIFFSDHPTLVIQCLYLED